MYNAVCNYLSCSILLYNYNEGRLCKFVVYLLPMTQSFNILRLLLFIVFPLLSHSQTSTEHKNPIDFSFAGYGAGIKALPAVPAVVVVKPGGGDDTKLLQAAIDAVAAMPLKNGFRGAIQLIEGTFKVSGQLNINKNGIVIRGSKPAGKSTTLIATGIDRRTLIVIGNEKEPITGDTIRITNLIIPAGSLKVKVSNVEGLAVGDDIAITRGSTKAWISALGMDTAKGAFADLRIHWRPGSRNIIWDRTITAVDIAKKEITLDAPITTAVEEKFGGATLVKVTANKPVENIGLEQLTLRSEFDTTLKKDEEHSWIGIQVENAKDVFLRQINFYHFSGSAVRVGTKARRVTIFDCKSLQPVSEIGGYRRHSYLVEGQQVLVYKCLAEQGVNDFAAGLCAGGPNVFLDCTATDAHDASGAFESWASGILYEKVRVDKAAIRIGFDMTRTQGAGWTAANSLLWNCTATELVAKGAEGSENIVVDNREDLYTKQLQKRFKGSFQSLFENLPVITSNSVKHFTTKDIPAVKVIDKAAPLPFEIINGRFVIGDKVVWGGSVNDAWWMGQTSPAVALDAGLSLTRFVPGRNGPGLTENLDSLARRIKTQKTPFFQSGPGLWYDRRRDDHTIVERTDWNAWAPFYELPWARSGQGISWEGLSKFDLTRYNPWYFNRINTFAQFSAQQNLVLYHSLYNTHNVLEIGAHWADFPWRPANCINETGIPEPPPMEPNNRLHMANQFYNTDHPNQKKLHEAYIEHVLDELGRNKNFVFNVGYQFVGPLPFQQFFLKEVAAWQAKNNIAIKVSLATSKDITDAILADPELSKVVSVIDMRYWQYRPDGTLYAPQGGKNLAFREIITKDFGKSSDAAPPTTPEQAYRQVREYRDKYPEKAIVVWHNGVGSIPALMAGAAQVLMQNPTAGHGQGKIVDRNNFDDFVDTFLSNVLYKMSPKDGILLNEKQNWWLSNDTDNTILIYSLKGSEIRFKQNRDLKNYGFTWYNTATGKTHSAVTYNADNYTINKPSDEDWLLLMAKK